MKILLLAEWLKNLGGCEHFIVQLYSKLRSNGVDVTVLCCGNNVNQRWSKILGEDLVYLESKQTPKWRLESIIRDRSIDLIHAIPYEKHAFDLVGTTSIPFIATEPSDGSHFCYWWYAGNVLQQKINYFDHLHVFSPHAKLNLESTYNYQKPVSSIPPIVEMDNNGSKWYRETAGKQLLYFGRLAPEKGVDTLFHVLNLLKWKFEELALDVWGTSSCDCSWLENLAISMGLRNTVRFIGQFESYINIPFSKYDAFIFPSHFEGCPYALIEALLTGIPCIATKRNGVFELIGNSKEILFVDDSVQSFTDGIIQLYFNFDYFKNSRKIRSESVSKVFFEPLIVNNYIDMYRCILKKELNSAI